MDARILKDAAGFISGAYPRKVASAGGYVYVAWSRDPNAAATAAVWHVHRVDADGNLELPKDAAGIRNAGCIFAANAMSGLTWT
jgi:hypothetical protein